MITSRDTDVSVHRSESMPHRDMMGASGTVQAEGTARVRVSRGREWAPPPAAQTEAPGLEPRDCDGGPQVWREKAGLDLPRLCKSGVF